ncbi:HNH endonuclease [Micromonospora coxensis]|uniref:HNH endonuclease n=1 Tax=Micromonospora coxensis TaxID=356852 RepID=UPI0018D5A1F0|nr:HNH endonuclease [Micromonospora coxensis]
MVRYKYAPERLGEVAAAAHSVTEVLRLLGVRVSGGSHAHISRQMKRFGIDTSHFTGSAHNRGSRGVRRTTSMQLLRGLPPGSRRTPGTRLKWALRDIGVPEQCEECGVGAIWQGRPLTLHVDHVNGDFLDNRPPNLRMLCPNCHSQTATYAGRNKRDTERAPPPPADATAAVRSRLGDAQTEDVLTELRAGVIGPSEAARRIGCHRNHVARLRERLTATGTVTIPPRTPRTTVGAAHAETIVAYALANPTLGPRRLADAIRAATDGRCTVSHGTVSTVLRRAGLHTVSARRSRLSGSAGVAERQTRRP